MLLLFHSLAIPFETFLSALSVYAGASSHMLMGAPVQTGLSPWALLGS